MTWIGVFLVRDSIDVTSERSDTPQIQSRDEKACAGTWLARDLFGLVLFSSAIFFHLSFS